MIIEFKKYNKEDKLDMLNKKLARVSKDRFELRIAKNGVKYIYDYDDREITRDKSEIIDILECMNLLSEFRELI